MNNNVDENVFFNFHDKDVLMEGKKDNVSYCLERTNDKNEWTPFLSFPVTKKCNFKCLYCGIGGEATASNTTLIELPLIKKLVNIGLKNGVKKFRLTGGEPLLHKDIDNILSFFSELGYFTLVNTNGSLITRKKELLSKLSKNIRFAVSLDTLKTEKLPMISKNNCLKDVLDGIRLLKEYGLLMRVNMVVGKHNYDEIFDIIHFCQEMECDLKILDIVSVPVPFGKRGDIYQEVTTLEEKLSAECDDIYSHEYTRGFGTPCFRYRFGKTYVTVKNSAKGSHYDREENGICSGCQYFPCHEGLYDLFALSDSRLCACRWTEKQKSSDPETQMKFLIEAFRRSKYIPKEDNTDMEIRVDLKEKNI